MSTSDETDRETDLTNADAEVTTGSLTPPESADPASPSDATGELETGETSTPPRRSLRPLWTRLGVAALVVIVVAASYVLVRYLVNVGSYHDGRAAYERADCAAAAGHFDDVINSWRLVAVGDEVGRAERDKAECLAFQVAPSRQQNGDEPGALAAYAGFLDGRGASPLTEIARQRVATLFDRPDPSTLATVDSCDRLNVLRGQGLKPPAAFHAACGRIYLDAGRKDDSIRAYVLLFRDFGQEEAATAAEADIIAQSRWCVELDRFRNEPTLVGRPDLLPGLLAACTKTLSMAEGLEIFEEFLKKYPGHRLTAQLMANFAARVNDGVRSQVGSRHEEKFLTRTRRVGGPEASLVIFNDAPSTLRIAFAGPEPWVVELPPCDNCPGPTSDPDPICTEKGPSQRIALMPGEYDVAEVFLDAPANGMGGNYAHVRLDAGQEYFSCWGLIKSE